MRIRFIKLRNVLSFDDVTTDPLDDEVNIFVGPNNSGKTNVARALRLVVDIIKGGTAGISWELVRHSSEKRLGFEIGVGVSFDGDEKAAIKEYFRALAELLKLPHAVDWSAVAGVEEHEPDRVSRVHDEITPVLREIYNAAFTLLAEAASEGELRVVWSGEPFKSPDVCYHFKLPLDGSKLPLTVGPQPPDVVYADRRSPVFDLGQWHCNRILPEARIGTVKEPVIADFVANIGNFLQGREDSIEVEDINQYAKALLKSILSEGALELPDLKYGELTPRTKVSVASIFDKYEMDYGREWPLLHFLSELFATKLVFMNEIRGEPKIAVRKVEFDEALRGEKRYGGSGADLPLFLLSLKNSELPARRETFDSIRRSFKELFRSAFDVSVKHYPYGEEEQYEVAIWMITESGKQLPLRMVGAGTFEVLNILCTVAGNKGCVIILDEPALHLHPPLQAKVLNLLRRYAKDTRNQFVVITHSPYFLSASDLRRTWRFVLDVGRTRVYGPGDKSVTIPFDQLAKLAEQEPEVKKALFSVGAVLVEGAEELLSLPPWLKKCDLDLESYSVEIISVNGRDSFRKCMAFMETFGIPYVIICDGKTALKSEKDPLPAIFRQLKELGKLSDEEERAVRQALQSNRMGEVLEFARSKGIFVFEAEDYADYVKQVYKEPYKRLKSRLRRNTSILREIALTEEPPNEVHQLAEFIREKLIRRQ